MCVDSWLRLTLPQLEGWCIPHCSSLKAGNPKDLFRARLTLASIGAGQHPKHQQSWEAAALRPPALHSNTTTTNTLGGGGNQHHYRPQTCGLP